MGRDVKYNSEHVGEGIIDPKAVGMESMTHHSMGMDSVAMRGCCMIGHQNSAWPLNVK